MENLTRVVAGPGFESRSVAFFPFLLQFKQIHYTYFLVISGNSSMAVEFLTSLLSSVSEIKVFNPFLKPIHASDSCFKIPKVRYRNVQNVTSRILFLFSWS